MLSTSASMLTTGKAGGSTSDKRGNTRRGTHRREVAQLTASALWPMSAAPTNV
jgi:hypothetical protein